VLKKLVILIFLVIVIDLKHVYICKTTLVVKAFLILMKTAGECLID